MDAPEGFCALCGKPAVQAHHITGRGVDRVQLHPDLTVDLCHRHHILIHADLRGQHIDVYPTDTAWTVTGRVEYVLRRLAVFIARFAQAADNPVWLKMAGLLESLADDIAVIDADLHPEAGAP